jgi:tRNA A-37 threonylcarbamoyl transferase component Bud32
LHDAGFDHPDLFAKHILAGADGATYRFCILDWQRGRRRHVVSWRLRCRDLAVLDATLHPSLADNRLRMRLLRAYRRASPGLAPLASMARDIRTAAMRLRARRHIREIGQLPVAACDHQFVPASEGRLLVVRSYYESNGGRLPEWLTRMAEPDAPAKELADALASASGSGFMLHTWPNDGLEWELPALAHTLFRLQRFGVPAPRLLAVGQSSRSVFLLATSVLAAPFRETFAKAPAPLQTQMLQRAGAIVRQIHAAGYALPAGESWDCRLGVVPATGAIVLVKAEPLLRDHAPGREPSQLAFDPKRMLLSPAEQLRFLQGYFEDERKVEARIRELSAVPASVEEAAR